MYYTLNRLGKFIKMYSPQSAYDQYYAAQSGTGLSSNGFYKGVSYQKGKGIGSFLGGLFRSAIPLFRSGARAFGQEALRAGVGLVNDLAEDRNLREALKRRAGDAGLGLLARAEKKIKEMSGGGRPRRALKRGAKAKKRQSRKPVQRRRKVVGKVKKRAVRKRKVVKKTKRRSAPRTRDIFG